MRSVCHPAGPGVTRGRDAGNHLSSRYGKEVAGVSPPSLRGRRVGELSRTETLAGLVARLAEESLQLLCATTVSFHHCRSVPWPGLYRKQSPLALSRTPALAQLRSRRTAITSDRLQFQKFWNAASETSHRNAPISARRSRTCFRCRFIWFRLIMM